MLYTNLSLGAVPRFNVGPLSMKMFVKCLRAQHWDEEGERKEEIRKLCKHCCLRLKLGWVNYAISRWTLL